MQVKPALDGDGTIWIVQYQDDGVTEITRFLAPFEQQPVKVQLAQRTHETVKQCIELKWRIDHIADYGLSPAVQAVVLNTLNAQYTAALSRDAAAVNRWRLA